MGSSILSNRVKANINSFVFFLLRLRIDNMFSFHKKGGILRRTGSSPLRYSIFQLLLKTNEFFCRVTAGLRFVVASNLLFLLLGDLFAGYIEFLYVYCSGCYLNKGFAVFQPDRAVSFIGAQEAGKVTYLGIDVKGLFHGIVAHTG